MAEKKVVAEIEKSIYEMEAGKEKMVTIRLPRIKADDAAEFVSINERTWLIKRGVEVEVPECVAILIRQREAELESAYAFEESVRNG